MSDATATPTKELYGLRGVVFLWFPIVGPIAAWAVHVLYISSIARFTCTVPSSSWTTHALTVVCVAVCLVALFLAWRLTHQVADEAEDTTSGRHLFMGRLAIIVAATNILVILLEELYTIGFHPVRCAV
jgi:membrane protein implicated in regulation of membrane protease activity